MTEAARSRGGRSTLEGILSSPFSTLPREDRVRFHRSQHDEPRNSEIEPSNPCDCAGLEWRIHGGHVGKGHLCKQHHGSAQPDPQVAEGSRARLRHGWRGGRKVVAVFSTKPYDRQAVEGANEERGHDLVYFELRLGGAAASLVRGARGQRLAGRTLGRRFVAQRMAGTTLFNATAFERGGGPLHSVTLGQVQGAA
jgi:hypothetical protein